MSDSVSGGGWNQSSLSTPILKFIPNTHGGNDKNMIKCISLLFSSALARVFDYTDYTNDISVYISKADKAIRASAGVNTPLEF